MDTLNLVLYTSACLVHICSRQVSLSFFFLNLHIVNWHFLYFNKKRKSRSFFVTTHLLLREVLSEQFLYGLKLLLQGCRLVKLSFRKLFLNTRGNISNFKNSCRNAQKTTCSTVTFYNLQPIIVKESLRLIVCTQTIPITHAANMRCCTENSRNIVFVKCY